MRKPPRAAARWGRMSSSDGLHARSAGAAAGKVGASGGGAGTPAGAAAATSLGPTVCTGAEAVSVEVDAAWGAAAVWGAGVVWGATAGGADAVMGPTFSRARELRRRLSAETSGATRSGPGEASGAAATGTLDGAGATLGAAARGSSAAAAAAAAIARWAGFCC